jgi:hypothetical protein
MWKKRLLYKNIFKRFLDYSSNPYSGYAAMLDHSTKNRKKEAGLPRLKLVFSPVLNVLELCHTVLEEPQQSIQPAKSDLVYVLATGSISVRILGWSIHQLRSVIG